MTQKLNCWQYKNCGREEGGILADELGVCPVSISMKHDGTNGGLAAGRVCWKLHKTSPPSLDSCANGGPACQQCAFFRRVQFEGIDLPIAEKPEPKPATKIAAGTEHL